MHGCGEVRGEGRPLFALMDGNRAAAEGACLCGVEVIPAYPITPASPVMEHLAAMIEGGRLEARLLAVESDHSALAAAVGASLTGARVFTATNSQGLAYMSELLYHASGLRLPIVMAVVNRAMSAPHSRFADQGDALGQEAAGWIQFHCESAQEVLDTVIQAFRVAEDPRVQLPVMVNYEAYVISHTAEPVQVPEAAAVRDFVHHRPRPVLDPDHPRAVNTVASPAWYQRYRQAQHAAMAAAEGVIVQVAAEFAEAFGRTWNGLLEEYRTADASTLLVVMGAPASTARIAVDSLRESGLAVGMIKIRCPVPFPRAAFRRAAAPARELVVVDRNLIPGQGGFLARQVRAAVAEMPSAAQPRVVGVVAGLGGGDITVEDLVQVTVSASDLTAEAAGGDWFVAAG